MRLAFVPSPPLLLHGLGGGPEDLRSACQQAISALDACDDVIVLGSGPVPGPVEGSIDASPWGGRGAPAEDPLPLALAVGATLLARPALLWAVGGPLPPVSDRTGLLVVGDGSARRTEKAPGHLDPRAAAFDAQVAAALASGDPAQLAGLDRRLGDDLLAAGVGAWHDAASLVAGRSWQATVLYDDAPYGVGYVVASWLPQ